MYTSEGSNWTIGHGYMDQWAPFPTVGPMSPPPPPTHADDGITSLVDAILDDCVEHWLQSSTSPATTCQHVEQVLSGCVEDWLAGGEPTTSSTPLDDMEHLFQDEDALRTLWGM